jgi:hypothetical protein
MRGPWDGSIGTGVRGSDAKELWRGEDMKSVYRVLAILIAVEVAIQSAAVALGVFGMLKWVDGGGTVNQALLESEDAPPFDEGIGFLIHALNGMYLIPLLALALLIVSFFAKIPGGAKWAGIVFVVTLVQVFLGLFAHPLPWIGALHGLNALLLFGFAVSAGMRARRVTSDTESPRTAAMA